MNKNEIIKELESYKYDYQYFLEKSKDNEKLKDEIEILYSRLDDMKSKGVNCEIINSKIKIILDKLAQNEDYLIKILDTKQMIEDKINSLGNPYRNIFFFRYILGDTFDEIALKMNYSTKRIYQLHKEGMEIYLNKYNSSSD